MARKSDTSTLFRVLAALAALALLAAAALVFLGGARPASSAAGLAALSQAAPRQAQAALSAEAGGFDALADTLARIDEQAGAGVPGSASDWRELEARGEAILASRAAVESVNDAARRAANSASRALDTSEALLDMSGATALLQEFQQRADRITRTARNIVLSPDPDAVAATIVDDAAFLKQVTDALAGVDTPFDVRPLDADAQEAVLVPLRAAVGELEDAAAGIAGTAADTDGLAAELAALEAAADRLLDGGFAAPAAASPLPASLAQPLVPLALIGLGVLLVVVLVLLNSRMAVYERRANEQAEQNERNQQAILRLLDEMGSLADGDLTVEATVTEDITGTIADSFNYAIEELRKLVATVNETAIMVDSAAKQTESSAAHMARAADNQAREINAATESIVSMAKSIEEVSGNAERSSDVARHSVEVAHKGGEAVRRTIDGMNTIRETIQDTSKRIKRLGESSQEIGNIVELINDIAEQTNILALNASIQASMAGEAGRGFAVVADEVQRLAERSTNATRQIEVLVSTIQADTKEAVVSMERSTTDVVGGALLAENAGAALDEIEQVSNQIATLVQNISGSARQQAGAAADVTRRTKRLREISEQTGKATTATAAAISKLSEFASQLRKSVAGFTLPPDSMSPMRLRTTSTNVTPPKADPDQKTGTG